MCTLGQVLCKLPLGTLGKISDGDRETAIIASALNSQKNKLAFRLIIYLGLYFQRVARTLWWGPSYQVARKINVRVGAMVSLIALFGENVCENKTRVGKSMKGRWTETGFR